MKSLALPLLLVEYDDFQPVSYSSVDNVRLVHKYLRLGSSLQEQDITFFSKKEFTTDYVVLLVIFPVFVTGICLIGLVFFYLCMCCRCCILACNICHEDLFLSFICTSYKIEEVCSLFEEASLCFFQIFSDSNLLRCLICNVGLRRRISYKWRCERHPTAMKNF